MLSLYFNSRLTTETLNHDSIDSSWFYPATYPRHANANSINQYEVLLRSIKSYAVLKFHTAIFNIAIDLHDNQLEEEIKNCINSNCSADNIIVNFTRPSTLEEWRIDAEYLASLIPPNSPILVIMNHDHPFVDYTPIPFNSLVEQVFGELESNLGKVLYYSHAPEVVSLVANSTSSDQFTEERHAVFTREVTNNWVVSLWVMTAETFIYILSRANCATSTYMGRIDWAGITYNGLTLKTYIFPREFFKHRDGYGHVTGIRLISDLRDPTSVELQHPGIIEGSALVEFYYQRWVDTFILAVRDAMRREALTLVFARSSNMHFRRAIEGSLDLFRKGYLESDARAGLIQQRQLNDIASTLRSHIYHNGNNLFELIKTDIILCDGELYKLKNLIRENIPTILHIVKSLKAKFSRL